MQAIAATVCKCLLIVKIGFIKTRVNSSKLVMDRRYVLYLEQIRASYQHVKPRRTPTRSDTIRRQEGNF
jgi:hypothetical protein